ncbi:hypothetical protein WN943_005881 [Citrus x changshan-huyou]
MALQEYGIRITGRIRLGCVIHKSDGGFLAARCVGRFGTFGPREAEALGIREALSWLKEYQLPCVIVEMNCLQVFQTPTEGFYGPNGFDLIIEDCRELSRAIGEVKFSFVRRSANVAAHSVLRAGYSMTDSRKPVVTEREKQSEEETLATILEEEEYDDEDTAMPNVKHNPKTKTKDNSLDPSDASDSDSDSNSEDEAKQNIELQN